MGEEEDPILASKFEDIWKVYCLQTLINCIGSQTG